MITQRLPFVIENRVMERRIWERLINGTWYRFTTQGGSTEGAKYLICQVEQWWADANHWEQVHQFVWGDL